MSLEMINDTNFDSDVIGSSTPVVVMFGASWCGPCKVAAPIFEKAAGEFSGKVLVFKVDVDEAPETARWCGIRSVPTFVAFKGGSEVARVQGAVTGSKMKEFLAALIS